MSQRRKNRSVMRHLPFIPNKLLDLRAILSVAAAGQRFLRRTGVAPVSILKRLLSRFPPPAFETPHRSRLGELKFETGATPVLRRCFGLAVLSLIAQSTFAADVPKPVEVKVIRPTRGEIIRYVTLPGSIRANQQATLYAKVAGYLKSLAVDKGDRVQAGQALGEIESVSEQLSSLIVSIARDAGRQSQTATEVSGSMAKIQETTTLTSAGSRQTAEAIGKLSDLARELQASVSGFKLPV